MKKFNKVLAVALAVLMLMMTSIPAFADKHNYGEVEVGELINCNIVDENMEFTFVAPYTGEFLVEACQDVLFDDYFDVYVYVYDAYGNEIAYDDDSGKNGGFAAPFIGYEGETYYIEIGTYSEQDSFFLLVSDFFHEYCFDNNYDGYCDGCDELLCDCDCHEDGILGFFWSIKNFFNRLFRIDEQCECGAWHW